jgi:hypothetical protein
MKKKEICILPIALGAAAFAAVLTLITVLALEAIL